MSGGRFDYNQHKIIDIQEKIQDELDKQGKEKSKEELWMEREYYEKYPEEKYNETYSEEVQQIFKDGIEVLKKAYIYAQRIDWYLSGEDGEENFISRLNSELELLNKNKI